MSRNNLIPKPITEYDLRLLRVFKSVVENGGFSAAESELGVSRSTISVHMGNLESRMKLKLCLRGRQGFTLTEAGQVVYHACTDLFDSLNDFSLLVRSLNSELSGELVILCADQLDGSKQKSLAKVVNQIHQRAPKINLVLDGGSIDFIEKSLLKDKAHIGLFPNYKPVDGLEYSPAFRETMYLCCARGHPLYDVVDDGFDESRLASYAAIHPGLDVDQGGRKQLQKLKLEAKAYQFDTRKTLILSAMYIGYLPLSYIKHELESGEIKQIHPAQYHYEFTQSLVSKKTPREQAKVTLVKEIFSSLFIFD
ncbi:LysR family transcriptional regulator [Aliiglaciecola sp. 3_MG-2023]|uniref:LysR family transcriptional regulator n=1 Tax=Aliiglaciecola sp. 3_MG-2023 TaxID=3062644 RepID=UPI0026E28C27|nr:LysR family transcriptional regulator [Aliiglaciecola sp. 3_MG-2023]MDO6694178.1 LysR family transcriptional regulator [Aliiglaciecola sp. 3_MG-2023]